MPRQPAARPGEPGGGEGEDVSKWIDPNDEKPPYFKDVLVIFNRRLPGRKRMVRVARYYKFDEWFVYGDDVTVGYYDNSHIEGWMLAPPIYPDPRP